MILDTVVYAIAEGDLVAFRATTQLAGSAAWPNGVGVEVGMLLALPRDRDKRAAHRDLPARP